MTQRDLEKRVDKLEQDDDRAMPELFLYWGREAGLDDDEIRAEWVSVASEVGDDDPMTVVWDRSLKGKLFNS